MADTVKIQTITDNPHHKVMGKVYVNDKLVLTVYPGGLDTHVKPNDTFDPETVKEMDRQLKAWIKENLKRN